MEMAVRTACAAARCRRQRRVQRALRRHRRLRAARSASGLDVPLGAAVEPDMLRDALKRTPVDAVTCVTLRNPTAVLQDVAEYAEVVKDFPDVLLLVDAVTRCRAAGRDRPLGARLCVTGSQKALACHRWLGSHQAGRQPGRPRRLLRTYISFLHLADVQVSSDALSGAASDHHPGAPMPARASPGGRAAPFASR